MRIRSGYGFLVAGATVLLSTNLSAVVQPATSEWTTCFTNAYLAAKETNIPIVLFYGHTSCEHCNNMSVALEQPAFKEWMRQRPFYFVSKHVAYLEHAATFPTFNHRTKQETTVPFDSSQYPDTWAATHWCENMLVWDETGVSSTGGQLIITETPIFRVYWETPDGEEQGGIFTGDIGKMPVTDVFGDNGYETLALQLMASIDALTAGYTPAAPSSYAGGEFTLSATELSHLEAVIGRTGYVDVPISRTAEEAAQPGTAVFRADFGSNGGFVEQPLEWEAGEKEKFVRVDIPSAGAGFAAGDFVSLYILDSDNTARSTNVIQMVESPANATTNPHWIGDFDEAGLPFGDWTMDLDVATNKVRQANGEAYTMVLFAGALWCPWCKRLDAGVLDTEAFKSFAVEKNAALVLIDNPRRSPDAAPTVPNGAPPTLLRYAEAAKDGASGAAYLSRNMISTNVAEAILQRNHNLGYTDLGSGGFRTPGSARVGYPTLFVLCKDGTVAGSLDILYDSVTEVVTNETIITTNTTYFCDTAKNMERLSALFDIAAEMNYRGGDFAVTDYENARLEAEIGRTETVYVPLARKSIVKDLAGTNTLHVSFAEKSPDADLAVSWAAGESEKGVAVDIPAAGFAEGDRLTLILRNGEGDDVATNHITVVAQKPVLPDNPHWVGDFSPEELPWGEWTFDYDAATNKVNALGGHVMAVFTGPLWCPDCFGAGESLFSPTNESFYAWMRQNKIVPVVFDQGRGSSPATAAGTLAPRLTTYECDPRKTGDSSVSGASYLSRHGLWGGDSEVKAVIDRITEKTAKWLAPEHPATTMRLGNPKIVLVRDDAVVARLREHEDSSKMFDPVENLGRLNDMLLLAKPGAPEEITSYRTTTTLAYGIGAVDGFELQVCYNQRFYAVTNVPAGIISFHVQGADGDKASLSLFSGAEKIATGRGSLVFTNTVPGEVGLSLCIAAYENEKEKYFQGGALSTCAIDLTLSSAAVLIPAEEKCVYAPPSQEVVLMVKAGGDYILGGFDEPSLLAHFAEKDGGTGVYTAVSDGEVTLSVTKDAAQIVYGIYVPGADEGGGEDKETSGRIAITETTPAMVDGYTVYAKEGGVVDITLGRLGGSIGAAAATAVATAGTLSRSDFAWEDGSSDALEVSLQLPSVADCPARKVILEIVGGGGTEVESSARRLVIRLLSSATPSFSSRGATFAAVRGVSVEGESSVVYDGDGDLSVVHVSGALPPGVTLAYLDAERRIAVKGVPKRAGEYAATYRVEAKTGNVTVKGDTYTVSFLVTEPSAAGGSPSERTLASWESRTWRNVPVVDLAAKRLRGLLTFTVPSSGKVSGKFLSKNGTIVFSSSGWDGMDETSVRVDIAGSDGMHTLSIELTGEDIPGVALADGTGAGSLEVIMPSKVWSADDPADRWRGLYTVGCYWTDGTAPSSGHIPLSLKMTGSASCAAGDFLWAGYLPNGKAVSGASTLGYDAEYADGVLPVFCHAGVDIFSTLVVVEPDGETLHADTANHAENHRIVYAHPDISSLWQCDEGEAVYEAYGQYYDPDESIKNCLLANGVGDRAEFTASHEKVADVNVSDDTVVSADGAKLTFGLKRESGIVGGVYVDKTTGATYSWRGVLLNGWTGCNCGRFDLPLVLGFHWAGGSSGGAVEVQTISAD